MNLKLRVAQFNFLVGDIEGNTQRIINTIQTAEKEEQTDLIIFPELTLTSYPAKDLWLRSNLRERVQHALQSILRLNSPVGIILGYPRQAHDHLYNEAAFIQHGKILMTYQKQHLPTYNVFDEARYFTKGPQPAGTFLIKNQLIALIICEDLWCFEPPQQAAQAGAQLLIVINASPFTEKKHEERTALIQKQSRMHHLPIVYANRVGGQDDLIFDGGSLVTNAQGDIIQQAPFFKELLWDVSFMPASPTYTMPSIQRIYEALVLGTRDYIEKNHFPSVLIGLSGGIDSALTLAIAVDAIGKDRVKAVMMPSRFTSSLSMDYAKQQAQKLGVAYEVISIEDIFSNTLSTLQLNDRGMTAENLQARCRGMLLMTLSNQTGALVLICSNKSEMAVGYSTLYGDMAGGFAVLKDVYKTKVYELVKFRNQPSPAILPEIIQRAPSAELAPNQKDQDVLPPYAVLDQILFHYIEGNQSPAEIVNLGFEKNTVKDIIRRLHLSEYKRQQAPIGIKVTSLSLGSDWRYPVTMGAVI